MAFLAKDSVPSISVLLSLYASLSTLTMLLRTILNEMIPKRAKDYIAKTLLEIFSSYAQSNFTFVIEQRWDYVENQTFRAAEVYLPTRLAGLTSSKLLVGSGNLLRPTAPPRLGIPVNTKIVDEFQGINLEWSLNSIEAKKNLPEKRHFHLTCKKEFRDKVVLEYLPFVVSNAEKILNRRENLKIYTYSQENGFWESTVFEHHSTFDTLAIEPDLKKMITDDLDAFAQNKEFFKSVGRAWKRGYLLYGPPGTGKSSLVAAIANYMKYHIYDLQMQSVKDDAELRSVLTSTKNRSILLIEDIDCNAGVSCHRDGKLEEKDGNEVKDQKPKERLRRHGQVSLSGLLNFVDGLWSSCGEERIIIFTTNHKEKLDPALLRPGRMDVHILMDYCTPTVFKKLAQSYLKIKDHRLFGRIENLIRIVKTTPAEVTQQLMASNDPDVALQKLSEFLETKTKKREADEECRDEVSEEVISEAEAVRETEE